MKIPRMILNLRGMTVDDKTIVRVISMNEDTDDVQVLVRKEQTSFSVPAEEYKIVLPIGRVLNILGYFKDEIREVVEEKKDVTIKTQVVVKDEKGEKNE